MNLISRALDVFRINNKNNKSVVVHSVVLLAKRRRVDGSAGRIRETSGKPKDIKYQGPSWPNYHQPIYSLTVCCRRTLLVRENTRTRTQIILKTKHADRFTSRAKLSGQER